MKNEKKKRKAIIHLNNIRTNLSEIIFLSFSYHFERSDP